MPSPLKYLTMKNNTPARLLSKHQLHKLYSEMLKIRIIEERIADLYPQGQMRCPVHLCIGQEAIAVGVCAHLTRNDLVLSNHRGHGHYLAKGGNVNSFVAELYGKISGCSAGRGGSMHLIDLSVNFIGSTPIVGSIVPVATGVAFAQKLKKSRAITAVFIGDAVVEEGVFHESLNFAVLKKLPIIYICENNLYSVYTRLRDRQPDRKISDLAKGHGAQTYTADGNDILTVYETMRKAVKAIKKNAGPVFIEFSTYRFREHCGPNFDNHIGYRTETEFLKWKKLDPLARFRQYLFKKHIPQKKLDSMSEKITEDFEREIKKVKSLSSEHKPVTENDVYAK